MSSTRRHRIREEVDQDANIILGATFDESLEGIIRVSVVATGIDQEVIANKADLSSTGATHRGSGRALARRGSGPSHRRNPCRRFAGPMLPKS